MSILFLQIQTGAEAVLAEEPTEKTMSILELMTSGGIGGILIMTFLGILSIFAVYIFLERFGAIRNANKVDPNFMNNIKDMVLDGKLDAAQALCTVGKHACGSNDRTKASQELASRLATSPRRSRTKGNWK